MQLEDIQALLADHVMTADVRVRELDQDTATARHIMSTPPPDGVKGPDPVASLELLIKLENIRDGRKGDLLRTAELLHRTGSALRPRVQVLAATQVNVHQGDTSEHLRPHNQGSDARRPQGDRGPS